MNIFFYARTVKPQYMDAVVQLFLRVQQQCRRVFILQEFHELLVSYPSYDGNVTIVEDDKVSDYALDYCMAVGGDGSFLYAASFVADFGIPLVGINLGRLGFLTDVSIDEASAVIGRLKNNDFTIEERDLLYVESETQGLACFGNQTFAINEITLSKKDISTLISLEMYINEKYVLTYWADGVIVSTPTGSTAYNLSCGGPIVFPSAHCWVITPYASHNLNVRPLVVPNNVTIKFHIACRTAQTFICTLDSRRHEVDISTPIIIKNNYSRLKIIKLNGYDFIDALTEKLHWGLDVRNS